MKLPDGWRSARLGKVVEVLYGRALPASQRTPDGRYPIVGSAGRMPSRTDNPLTAGPALVVGRKGNVGHVTYEPSGSWPVDTTYYIEPPTGVFDGRFLFFQLTHLDLKRLNSSTAVPSLRRPDLERQVLAIPPPDEQRRIVDILEDHLSRLDAANDYLSASAKRLRAYCAGALSSLATDADPVVALASAAVESRYGTSTKCVPGGAGAPVVRIPNLRGGIIDLADEKRAETAEDLSALMLRAGDVLVVRTNGSKDLIGRTAVVQSGIEAAFASYLIRYRFDPTRVVPEWIHLMLDRPEARRRLEELAASSAGQYNLGLKKLDGVEVPLPSIDEQQRRIEAYSGVAQRAGLLSSTLNASRRRSGVLRQALLAAAFSGRLTGRSSDLDFAEEFAS